LEFYIPQILAHYLRSDLEIHQEIAIENMILQASELNMFFAHRIWFNLKASLLNKCSDDQNLKIFQLKKQIEMMIAKSPEKLYLANSTKLIRILNKSRMTGILPPELQEK